MRILSLQLENIKSYHDLTEIQFTAGLNAVCGQNGSGKTTVLESIGCALFDYSPYQRSAFVREGERSGTIRVRILAPDEREYEIVRRVGSPNQHYVIDIETGAKLVDRGPEVLEWIQTRALGIDGATDMPALFKNAVGVPQGLMTADFLVTAASRKAIFDPLLRVQEYRDAFASLLDTLHYLRDVTAGMNADIGRLEADTDRIPELETRASELRARVEAGVTAVTSLSTTLHAMETRQIALDELAIKIESLKNELQGARYDVQRFSDLHAEAERSLERARAAHADMLAAEPGYIRLQVAHEALGRLEERRAERDALHACLATRTVQLQGIYRAVERLDAEIARAKTSAKAAAALAPDVERQRDLERTQRDLEGELRAGPDLEQRYAATLAEIESLRQQQDERAQRLLKGRAAREEARELPAAQERTRDYRAQLALFEPMETELEKVMAEGKALKDAAKLLSEQVQRQDRLRQEAETLAPAVRELDALQTRLNDLREERARLTATVQYGDVARTSLMQRQCPILELTCPVVTSKPELLQGLEGRSSDARSQLAELEVTLGAMNVAADDGRKATARWQELQVEIAKRDGSEERLTELRATLGALLLRHNELSDTLKSKDTARRHYDDAVVREAYLLRCNDAAQMVSELESQVEQSAAVYAALIDELHGLEQQRAFLEERRVTLSSIEAQLSALENPRERQASCLTIAARQLEYETERAGDLERCAEIERETAELRLQLEPFAGLDDEIQAERDTIQVHRPAYETYLRCQDEAASVPSREGTVTAALDALLAAGERESTIVTALAALAETYDGSEHERLRVGIRGIGQDMATENERLQAAQSNLQDATEELEALSLKKRALDRHRAERDEIGRVADAVSFIRNTINSAGPLITETLLAQISQGANDIFSEIMDDHAAELRWDKDYEIVVQRGAETRKFNQLSGGEQMSAALAVRLALLKEMSEVDFAFFDEPTQNMDGERRSNLAEQISHIKGFDQLIVISHDDTFEHNTENLVRLRKIQEETHLESD